MADEVIRRALVQIGFDVESSPLDKIRKETEKFQKTMKKFGDDPAKLKEVQKEFRKLNQQKFATLSKNLDKITKKVGTGLVSATKKASKAIGALAVAGGAGVFKLADMASDLDETLNKVKVSFGEDNSKAVTKWAKSSITQMGMAEQTALDMAAGFGDMGTAMGLTKNSAADMSMELVQRAADLASFKNMELSDVQTALNGIFTGETESLKRLGVVMTQTNLEDFAKKQGKVLKNMSESEKVTLRYQYVLEKTKNAQNDFKNTGGGFANQLRQIKEQLKQIGTTIGGVFVDKFAGVMKIVNDFGAKLNSTLSEAFADGFQFEDIAKIAPVLGPVGKVIQTIANKIKAFTSNGEKMKAIKSIFESIKTVVGNVASVIGTLAGQVWDFVTSTGVLNTVKAVFAGISKAVQWVKDNLGWLLEIVKSAAIAFGIFMVVVKGISLAMGAYNAILGIFKTIKLIATAAQLGFNAAMLACPITWIVVAIVALIAVIVLLVRNWDKVKEVAVNCWNKIKEIWGIVSSWFKSNVIDPVVNFFKGLWESIVGIFKSVINWVKENFKSIILFIINPFAGVFSYLYNNFEGFRNFVDKIISSVKNFFVNLGKNIANIARNIKDSIVDAFKTAWDKVTGVWNGIKKFFSGIWSGLKDTGSALKDALVSVWKTAVTAVSKPINKLIGGANWILEKLGSKKVIAEWQPYARGTNGHPGGNAMVNDGRGAELVQMPNGNTFIPKGRNVLLPNAPKGMKVLDAERTARLMGRTSPSFNYEGGIGDWDIWDFFDDAKGLIGKVVDKFVSFKGMGGYALDVGKAMISKATGAMTGWVKNLFSKFGGKDISSYVASAGVEQWRSTVVQALKMEGQHTAENVKRTLHQMQTESGGNPKAINNWDVNARRGTPSKGLMQVIDPTFRAYARKGYNKNIYDPLSNILASVRYAVSRYGTLAKAYRGVGYANGIGFPRIQLPAYSPEGSVPVSSSNSTSNHYNPSFTLNMQGTVDRTTERTIKRWVMEALEETFEDIARTNPRLTEV